MVSVPAEEGGGLAMAGQRFGASRLFGWRNPPGLPADEFAMRPKAMIVAADFFDIDGADGHAALAPASRETNPPDAAGASFRAFHAGAARNIIPPTATLTGAAQIWRAAH